IQGTTRFLRNRIEEVEQCPVPGIPSAPSADELIHLDFGIEGSPPELPSHGFASSPAKALPSGRVYCTALPMSLPRSFTPTAVFSAPFSVYFTVTCEPSATPFPASLVPSQVVLLVHLMVCSVPSVVLTTMVLVPLSTCFTAPDTTWVRSSAAALCKATKPTSTTRLTSATFHFESIDIANVPP